MRNFKGDKELVTCWDFICTWTCIDYMLASSVYTGQNAVKD